MKTTFRTHTCGELAKVHAGLSVRLAGWVDSSRDHGGLIFIDLRDRYGRTQCVFNPEKCREAHALAEKMHGQYVIQVEGTVEPRPAEAVNPKLPTGEIEIHVKKVEVLAASESLPFEITDESDAGEDIRLKYRYLDLRRPKMQRNLLARHLIVRTMRRVAGGQGVRRDRDAPAHEVHARRREELPGAQPHQPRPVLRPGRVAATLQATPDDGRLRPLLPDRPVHCATRTCGPTASRSSPSWTSRWPSSPRPTSWP